MAAHEEDKNDTPQDDLVCRCNGGDVDLGCDQLVAVTPVTRRQLRTLAFHYLYALDRSDYQDSLEEVASQFLDHFNVRPKDQTFALALAQGVADNRDRYGVELQPMLEHWRVDRLGCCTRLVLYMAMWELEQPAAIASIIINEAVELAKAFAERDAYRFVNGTLDQLKLKYPHSVENEKLSLAHNHHSKSESSSSSASSSSDDAESVACDGEESKSSSSE